MANETEKPKTVKVKALTAHTYHGKAYDAGDVYEIEHELVDSIIAQRKAAPVTGDEPTEKSKTYERSDLRAKK